MPDDQQQAPKPPDANVPTPPREHGVWVLAGALALLGVAALVMALLAGGRSDPPASAMPPAVPAVAATPTPGPAASASVLAHTTVPERRRRAKHGRGEAIPARPSSTQQQL
ncbi:MAG: hypothetical protein QOI18_891, partial [Solirubrobacteraceae bacterium]|nr:hypothetical protein [Solirubrobacteraceae bacterium]